MLCRLAGIATDDGNGSGLGDNGPIHRHKRLVDTAARQQEEQECSRKNAWKPVQFVMHWLIVPCQGLTPLVYSYSFSFTLLTLSSMVWSRSVRVPSLMVVAMRGAHSIRAACGSYAASSRCTLRPARASREMSISRLNLSHLPRTRSDTRDC